MSISIPNLPQKSIFAKSISLPLFVYLKQKLCHPISLITFCANCQLFKSTPLLTLLRQYVERGNAQPNAITIEFLFMFDLRSQRIPFYSHDYHSLLFIYVSFYYFLSFSSPRRNYGCIKIRQCYNGTNQLEALFSTSLGSKVGTPLGLKNSNLTFGHPFSRQIIVSYSKFAHFLFHLDLVLIWTSRGSQRLIFIGETGDHCVLSNS